MLLEPLAAKTTSKSNNPEALLSIFYESLAWKYPVLSVKLGNKLNTLLGGQGKGREAREMEEERDKRGTEEKVRENDGCSVSLAFAVLPEKLQPSCFFFSLFIYLFFCVCEVRCLLI